MPRSSNEAPVGAVGFGDAGLHPPIVVRQSYSTQLLALFFGGIVAVVVVGLFFGNFSKQEPVRGYVSLASGITRITSPGSGTVLAVLIKQGDQVEAGQKLVRVRSQQLSAGTQTSVAVEQSNLEKRRGNLVAEIAKIDDFITRLRSDRDFFNSNHDRLITTLDQQEKELRTVVNEQRELTTRFAPLVKTRDMSQERYSQQERALNEYLRQLSEVIARRNTVMAEHSSRIMQLEGSLTEQLNAKTERQSMLSSLDTEFDRSKASGEFDIVATKGGTVASVMAAVGGNVLAEQMVVTLGDPNAQQIIMLNAPAKSMGFVNPGQRVVIKYDAFPYKTFGVKGGTVMNVSQAPNEQLGAVRPDVGMIENPAAARNEALARQTNFSITVKPDAKTIFAYGSERPIVVGSTLTVDIVIERRRLIDWVIDPILAMRGRT